MSPCNHGGTYPCRLHPRSRKCACQFLWETDRVKSNCAREASASWRQQRWSHGVFKASFLLHVVHNHDISALQQVGTFFQWDRLLDESSALVRAGVPSYSDAVTHRSCANFKCAVADRCKQTDSHWFEGCKMGSWWMGSTIPWKHFKICSAWLFSAVGFWFGSSCMPFSAIGWLAPATACEAQGEPVTSRLTQHAWVLCQLYVQGE